MVLLIMMIVIDHDDGDSVGNVYPKISILTPGDCWNKN